MSRIFNAKNPSVRNAVEDTVKKMGISSTRFAEFSKTGYGQILNQFLYAFADHEYLSSLSKKNPGVELPVRFVWIRLRTDLETVFSVSERDSDFNSILDQLPGHLAAGSEKIFMITGEGWVYLGVLDEVVAVLKNLAICPEEIYLVTPDFKNLAFYCADGEMMQILRHQSAFLILQ